MTTIENRSTYGYKIQHGNSPSDGHIFFCCRFSSHIDSDGKNGPVCRLMIELVSNKYSMSCKSMTTSRTMSAVDLVWKKKVIMYIGHVSFVMCQRASCILPNVSLMCRQVRIFAIFQFNCWAKGSVIFVRMLELHEYLSILVFCRTLSD